MTPIIPHFANECLELINIKEQNWPEFNKSMLKEDLINIVFKLMEKKRELFKRNLIFQKKNYLTSLIRMRH